MIGGVDVALWDIYGKSLGVPIYRLLGGGVRERMPVHGGVGRSLILDFHLQARRG